MAQVRRPHLTASGRDAVVRLDGAGLDAAGIAALADGRARPEVAPEALARAERTWRTAQQLTAGGRLYGRHTGVGAHRGLPVGEGERAGQDLRLLRSHAGGVGALLPARQVRAMLAVRANQILAGGSGLHPAFVTAMAEALRVGAHPAVNEFGAVGTGDLTALAQTGLTLIGERPWIAAGGGTPRPVALTEGDALALMSSSALTIAQSALAAHTTTTLLRASHAVAALSLAAVQGSPEPYTTPTPYPSTAHAATEVLRLLAWVAPKGRGALPDMRLPPRERDQPQWPPQSAVHPSGADGLPPARIQDPYGFRAFPQVQGAALDAVAALDRTVAAEANTAAENPLITVVGAPHGDPAENPLITVAGAPHGDPAGAAYHHGAFFTAHLALALDHANLGLLQAAQLSAARLAAYGEPELTGQRSYLAAGPAASSGVMILEYSAHSALAELRAAAHPASAGHAVLSRGLEEAASFASQGARQALRAAGAYRLVLACELVAAVRALRARPGLLDPAAPAAAVLDRALPAATEDRPLSADVATAADLLPALAEL